MEQEDSDRKEIILIKGGHRYVFRYEVGQEINLFAGLVAMARDPQSGINWFDVGIISHPLGDRMTEVLDRLRDPK
ncbi:MAG: hypothetical protein RJA61_309 [Candidatus Parcubacteria bacterium]|jgi:hypothetical protein